MSGRPPPKSEGPRDTNPIQDKLAHGRTILGCLRGTILMSAIAVLWLLLNIYADYIPFPWRPRPLATPTIVAPAPIATILPVVTIPPVVPVPPALPVRTATPVPTPTVRR